MIIVSSQIDPRQLMQALARLKDVPLSKVVRNASRDFAQAAVKATPLAKTSRSEYYKYYDRLGQPHFLHESQVFGRKSKKGLHKARVHKGWSKASWLGVFKSLGMSLGRDTTRLPSAVGNISYAVTRGNATESSTEMTDFIHFDSWGRTQDTQREAIARAGFALAGQRISKEVNRMLARQWEGRR